MKKLLLILLLSSFPIHTSKAEEKRECSIDSHREHELFTDMDLCRDLCDDDDLHQEVPVPESRAKEWLTKVGCIMVAKYYVVKNFFREKYQKARIAFLRAREQSKQGA